MNTTASNDAACRRSHGTASGTNGPCMRIHWRCTDNGSRPGAVLTRELKRANRCGLRALSTGARNTCTPLVRDQPGWNEFAQSTYDDAQLVRTVTSCSRATSRSANARACCSAPPATSSPYRWTT